MSDKRLRHLETMEQSDGTVAGTGAAPRVAFWSAATVLDSDAGLTVDAANDFYVVADAGGMRNNSDTARVQMNANGSIQADSGGNARGIDAIDWQMGRTAATQVASGNYAFIAGGFDNTASNTCAYAEGRATTASGIYSHAEGYLTTASGYVSRADGEGSTAAGTGSHAGGAYASALLLCEYARSAGRFATAGDAQRRNFVMRLQQAVADATWYQLYLDGAAARLTIPTDTLWNFDIKLVGLTSGAPQRWSYDIRGTVVNDGGTTTLIESAVTARAESDAAYDARVVGNDALDCLDIEVQRSGGTGYTVRWVAIVDLVQVTYP